MNNKLCCLHHSSLYIAGQSHISLPPVGSSPQRTYSVKPNWIISLNTKMLILHSSPVASRKIPSSSFKPLGIVYTDYPSPSTRFSVFHNHISLHLFGSTTKEEDGSVDGMDGYKYQRTHTQFQTFFVHSSSLFTLHSSPPQLRVQAHHLQQILRICVSFIYVSRLTLVPLFLKQDNGLCRSHRPPSDMNGAVSLVCIPYATRGQGRGQQEDKSHRVLRALDG